MNNIKTTFKEITTKKIVLEWAIFAPILYIIYRLSMPNYNFFKVYFTSALYGFVIFFLIYFILNLIDSDTLLKNSSNYSFFKKTIIETLCDKNQLNYTLYLVISGSLVMGNSLKSILLYTAILLFSLLFITFVFNLIFNSISKCRNKS